MIYLLHTPQDCPVIATEYCLVLNFSMFHSINRMHVSNNNVKILINDSLKMFITQGIIYSLQSINVTKKNSEFLHFNIQFSEVMNRIGYIFL